MYSSENSILIIRILEPCRQDSVTLKVTKGHRNCRYLIDRMSLLISSLY